MYSHLKIELVSIGNLNNAAGIKIETPATKNIVPASIR